MRTLAFGLATAAMLAAAVPANAQIYVEEGDWGYGYSSGPSYGYRDGPTYSAWGTWGPRTEVVVTAPRARIYVEDEAPRRVYRRGYAYDSYGGYAYAGSPYGAYAYYGYPYGHRSWRGW
jgi:hypothetical protein